MKNNNDKRTLWVGFLTTPTEQEIQDAANTMKGGKAYLFKDENGGFYLENKRFFTSWFYDKVFIRKILITE